MNKNINDNPGNTKKRILEVSEKLFAEKGYANTGVDEIAKQVGIAKSVIYHHFKSKGEILQMLAKSLSVELNELKKSMHDDQKGKNFNTIENILSMLLKFWESHRKIATIILAESLKSSNEVPLFDFWDENIKSVMESMQERSGPEREITPEIRLNTFFMLFMPAFSFTVFKDKWSNHYSTDSEKVQLSFEKTLTAMCRTFGKYSGI